MPLTGTGTVHPNGKLCPLKNGRCVTAVSLRNHRPAVSEAKRPPGPRSGLKYPLGLLLLESSRCNSFQGGGDWRGYKNVYKVQNAWGGPNLF
jgi:hypothetical protein